jgi:hypothetical protein
MGMGEMTGRGAGYCEGSGMPGYANPAPGRGFGMVRGLAGGGRGWRHWFHATGLPGWMRFGGKTDPYGYTIIANNKFMKKAKKLALVGLLMGAIAGVVIFLYKKGKLPYLLPVPPSQQ